jgi:hypothetical protein
MAHEGDASGPRSRGQAAWRAELDATEQRNAAAKQKARADRSAAVHATAERERRMAQLEASQLAALNRRLDARAGDGR